MRKKLTITLGRRICERLCRVIGRCALSRWFESLVRFHLSEMHLHFAYRAMTRERSREAEALAWAESSLD